MARREYSPFPAMSVTSFAGNLLATFTIAKGFDGSKDFRLETGIAAVLLSASGLMAFAELCKPEIDASIERGSVRPEEFDRADYEYDRRMFFLAHTLNSIQRPRLL